MFPACPPLSYLDKRQAKRKRTLRFFFLFLQHKLKPPFPSKIQPTKNKWACHHRSENSFGLQPRFDGLYGSAKIVLLGLHQREIINLMFVCRNQEERRKATLTKRFSCERERKDA